MAPVFTVCITDAEGDALITRKYAATATAGWEDLLKRAMADVAAALQERPTLRVGVVQDGAHELWIAVRAALATVPAVTSHLEAVDRYHLNERLGKVLQLIEKDPTARRQRQARWNHLLDTRLDAAATIEGEVIRARRRLDAAGRGALHEHVVYLSNNKDRMRYVALREDGLPIGSGTTESGCNTLLNLRVKRNAEHWSVEGLQGVLTLRGIHESLRFEGFWQYFARRYQGKVEARVRPRSPLNSVGDPGPSEGHRLVRSPLLAGRFGEREQLSETHHHRLEPDGDFEHDRFHGAPCAYGDSATPPSHGSAPASTPDRLRSSWAVVAMGSTPPANLVDEGTMDVVR